jgi:hypothetical protein
MLYKLKQKRAMFGKNSIITDNTDWTTSEIVQASLDRWQVEDQFRLSNDEHLVNAQQDPRGSPNGFGISN